MPNESGTTKTSKATRRVAPEGADEHVEGAGAGAAEPGEFVFAPLTGPSAERDVTLEEFRAGYVPNDDDMHELIATPIKEMALASFRLQEALWVVDGTPPMDYVFMVGAVQVSTAL